MDTRTPVAVKCAECVSMGRACVVRCVGAGMVRGNGGAKFADEMDATVKIMHDHTPGYQALEYRCSNGHTWEARNELVCHCGWRASSPYTKMLGA